MSANRSQYLFSPFTDFMLAGGAALVAVVLLAVFFPYHKATQADVVQAGILMGVLYWVAYFVNYPHFMASYQLLYRNFPERLKTHRHTPAMFWRLVVAGIVVPLALLALMVVAVVEATQGNKDWIGVSIQVMLFFVGWHYAKQAFGVMVVLSAVKKVFYSPRARQWLLTNAYLVWLASWAWLSVSGQYLGIAFQQGFLGTGAGNRGYDFIEVPAYIRTPLLAAAIISTLGSLWAVVSQWRKTSTSPSVAGVTGYLSMYYLWAFVAVLHPEWALVAPVFHSLQYLLFVAAYKRGETAAMLEHAPPEKHKKIKHRIGEFFALSFVLGIIAFNALPYQIEQHMGFPHGILPLLFLLFINVHHYFIDNVLWRKENADISQYLFHRSNA